MRDLEKVVAAAKTTGESIRESVWVADPLRSFLANAFLAFGDDLQKIVNEDKKREIAAAD